MANENFTVLRTFKADFGNGKPEKVEQLKGDKDRQDISYKVFVNILEFPDLKFIVYPHHVYWQLHPVEIKD